MSGRKMNPAGARGPNPELTSKNLRAGQVHHPPKGATLEGRYRCPRARSHRADPRCRRGPRMRSDSRRSFYRICGRPMIEWPIAAAERPAAGRIVVVDGPERKLQDALPSNVAVAIQEEPNGTGDAVRSGDRPDRPRRHRARALRRRPADHRRRHYRARHRPRGQWGRGHHGDDGARGPARLRARRPRRRRQRRARGGDQETRRRDSRGGGDPGGQHRHLRVRRRRPPPRAPAPLLRQRPGRALPARRAPAHARRGQADRRPPRHRRDAHARRQHARSSSPPPAGSPRSASTRPTSSTASRSSTRPARSSRPASPSAKTRRRTGHVPPRRDEDRRALARSARSPPSSTRPPATVPASSTCSSTAPSSTNGSASARSRTCAPTPPPRQGQGRHVRGDQELADRRGHEGPAPLLHRRRRRRPRHQHRRRHDHRQLRRRQQAPHHDWRTREGQRPHEPRGARKVGDGAYMGAGVASPTTCRRARWASPASASATSRATQNVHPAKSGND